MDASGNVTFPANATCSGTASGFGGGKLVNYAQTFKTDTFSADVAQGAFSGDAISISYAAANSNNKLLITSHLMIGYESNQRIGFALFIGGNQETAASGDASGIITRITMGGANTGNATAIAASQAYLFGGSGTTSTSATTYSCRLFQGNNGTDYLYLNRTHWNDNYNYGYRGTSSMTIMEFEP
jgi:hypothetical protein